MISVTNKMKQNYVFVDSFRELEQSSVSTVSPVGSRVGALFQKAVYTVKVLLKMGETVARNMLSRPKRINKNVIFLHLFGYGYHCGTLCLSSWKRTDPSRLVAK